jgi:hypothetical protein
MQQPPRQSAFPQMPTQNTMNNLPIAIPQQPPQQTQQINPSLAKELLDKYKKANQDEKRELLKNNPQLVAILKQLREKTKEQAPSTGSLPVAQPQQPMVQQQMPPQQMGFQQMLGVAPQQMTQVRFRSLC